MGHFFRIIKKKKHKRKIGALWLFLIVLEVFCPVLCNSEEIFAAAAPSTKIQISTSDAGDKKTNSVGDKFTFSEESISLPDSLPHDDNTPANSNDDCICHGAVLTSIPVLSSKEFVLQSERINFYFTEPIITSLSPPHRPPKIS